MCMSIDVYAGVYVYSQFPTAANGKRKASM